MRSFHVLFNFHAPILGTGRGQRAVGLLWLSLFLLLGPCAAGAGQAEDAPAIAVVVHVSRAKVVGSLNAVTLEAIFSRRKQFWGDGQRIVALNHPEDSLLRTAFDKVVLGLDPAAAKQHWVDQKVRGGPRPPLVVSSTAVLSRSLRVMKTGIGYLAAGSVPDDLHVVAVIRGGKAVKQ